MGVWIETNQRHYHSGQDRSHPVWVCGLKLAIVIYMLYNILSHPVWVCGLKQDHCKYLRYRDQVTPCMGVWIETLRSWKYFILIEVTPCMGVWIETGRGKNPTLESASHTLYGCVDWNLLAKTFGRKGLSHTLYGCVDWNKLTSISIINTQVTPCMGVWIETSWQRVVSLLCRSHPVWVCGLKLGASLST